MCVMPPAASRGAKVGNILVGHISRLELMWSFWLEYLGSNVAMLIFSGYSISTHSQKGDSKLLLGE